MHINQQPPEGPGRTDTTARDVFKIFYTMQGEGPFNGTPAVFLRLSGCNLQCPACDTDYTSQRRFMMPAEIADACESAAGDSLCRLVVITGGEPFRQDLTGIVNELHCRGWKVQIETNGTLAPHGNEPFPFHNVTIVCSPKTPRINGKLEPHIAAYKYVIQDGFVDTADGLPTVTLGKFRPARKHEQNSNTFAEIFVQPLDEQDPVKNANNTRAALESCMKYGYRLCLQTHKMLNLE
jgi:organic radical activating enzyme